MERFRTPGGSDFFFLLGFAQTRTVALNWIWLGVILTVLESWNAGNLRDPACRLRTPCKAVARSRTLTRDRIVAKARADDLKIKVPCNITIEPE